MKQLILVGNQKVKFQDTETIISLTLVSDGNTVTIDKTKTYSVKIKNGTGYIKAITATPDTTNNMVTFSTSGFDGLPVDSYFIELWVIDGNGQNIYPSDSFIEVDITANATGVQGQVVPAITLQEFEDRFSTLQSNLETKVGTLIGPTGATGNGIDTVVTQYQLSSSGSNVPTGTWSDSPVTPTDTLPYMWTRNVTTYTDKSTSTSYNISAKGTKGNNFTIQGSTSSIAGLPSTGTDGEGYLVGTELYVWTNGKWNDIVDMKGDKGDQGIQGIQGIQGDTGNGISSATIQYQISSSATTTPTGTWSNNTIATTNTNPYLWTKATLNYTDNTKKDFYLVSQKGDKGNSVWSMKMIADGPVAGRYITDLYNASATNVPAVNDVVIQPDGKVFSIVNVETTTLSGAGGYTFDMGPALYNIKGPQGIQGIKGDTGNGISSTITQYQLSSSSSNVPTGTWSDSPVTPTDTLPYMWTRNVTTYTDKSTHVSYNISAKGTRGNNFTIQGHTSSIAGLPSTGTDGEGYMVGTELYVWTNGKWNDIVDMKGVKGDQGIQGIQGIKGNTGTGISSVTTEYELSNQGSEVPRTGWSSTVLTMTNDLPYLWTRVTITFTDGSKNMVYFTSNKGDKGDTGKKGDKGDTGANLAVKGAVDKDTDLPTSGNAEGDAYLVGTNLYVYTKNAWKNCGPIVAENTVLYNADGSLNVNGTNYNYVQDLRNGKIQYNDGTKNIELTPVDSQKEAEDILSARNYTDTSISALSTSVDTKLSSKANSTDLTTGLSTKVTDNKDGTITANNLTYDLSKTGIAPIGARYSGSFNDLPLGTVFASNSVTDGPDKTHAFTTTTFYFNGWNPGRKAQIAIADSENLMYFRIYTGASWKSWTLLSDDSKVVHSADMRKPASDVAGIEEVSTLKTQVDNSAVGINLAIGTNQEYVMGFGIPSTTWKDGYAYLQLPVNNAGEILPQDPHTFSYTLIQGITYTQTIWFETDATVKDLSAAQITWYTSAGHDYQPAIVQKLGQNSYKLVSTYTFPGRGDNTVRLFDTGNLKSAFDLSTGTYLKFGKLKLEKGSLSTDWCPNSEDKVNVADMRKPASDVAGIEEVNAKQDKIGYTPADDSKVLHSTIVQSSGTDLDTMRTAGFFNVQNGLNTAPNSDNWTIYHIIPLSGYNGVQIAYNTNKNMLAKRTWTGGNAFSTWVQFADDSKVVHNTGTEEISGTKTFDTAPIDKKTGNPYITKEGVPAVPSTLADTTKLSNFTAGLQSKGVTVATSSDLTTGLATKQDKIGYTPANDSKVVHSSDMRKPASDVAGIEEVNAKQDKIGYTPADDSKVLHNSGLAMIPTDNSGLIVGNNGDIGLVKKNGYSGAFGVGAGNTFHVVQSNHSSIGIADTFHDMFKINGNYQISLGPGAYFTPADDSKVVHSTDMRKPANDVAGIEEVNAKQDKIGYTPANDSKVVHNTGTEEIAGQKTFDTAPIDKATGNPYITKSGVPAVPSTLADTTKDANFTGKLQKSGIDVATTTDVSTAVNGATSQVAHLVGTNNFSTVPTVNNNPLLLASSLPSDLARTSQQTNFTAGLQSGGINVATAADLNNYYHANTSDKAALAAATAATVPGIFWFGEV